MTPVTVTWYSAHRQPIRKIVHIKAALRSDYYGEYWVWKQAAAPAGRFLAAFVSKPTHWAGTQMFAPGQVGMRMSQTDFGSPVACWPLKNSLCWTVKSGFIRVRFGEALYEILKYIYFFAFLEGFLHPKPDRRRNLVPSEGLIAGRRSAVVPFLPLPATPPSSTINPTPPCQNTPHLYSGGRQSKPNTVPASPSDLHPAAEEKDEVQEREPQPAVVSITESDSKLRLGPAGLERSPSSTSVVSHQSLSDLGRPSSSLFSRSTNLASGRISVLSGKTSTVTAELALAWSLLHKGLKVVIIVDYFLVDRLIVQSKWSVNTKTCSSQVP